MVETQHAASVQHVLDDARHQIVVVGFGDLAATKLAGRERLVRTEIVDEDLAIDFGSVHGGASFPQHIGFFRGTFDEQIELASDELLLLATADALLQSHQLLATALDLRQRNFAFQRICSGPFLDRKSVV